jgi:hypothetical protein
MYSFKGGRISKNNNITLLKNEIKNNVDKCEATKESMTDTKKTKQQSKPRKYITF